VVFGTTLSAGPAYSATVARYKSDGSLDTGFGGMGTGFRRIQNGDSSAYAGLLQGTKILMAGSSGPLGAVWRLNSDGTDDLTFGNQGGVQLGIFRQDTSQSTPARFVDIALSASGRIHLAGTQGEASAEQSAGYAAVTSDGQAIPDRVFPEYNGLAYPILGSMEAMAIAVDGERVFLAGTRVSEQMTTISAIVLRPERLADTAFDDNRFGIIFKASMGTDQDIVADQAFLPPGSDDIALLHLKTGMLMNGSRTGYTFPGFHANPSALVGTNVVCKGYGNSSFDNGWQIGAGTLRVGTSRLTGVEWARYLNVGFLPSPAIPQVPLRGDSGGACTPANSSLLIGVVSRGTDNTAWLVSASRFAAWAKATAGIP